MGKLDKPIAPSKNAPRSLWLQYWREVREWAQKDMKLLQHGIDRDIKLVKEAQNRIKKLKDKLELEEVLAWDVNTSVSGTNITIDVRGETNKIIKWKAYVTIYSS